MPINWGLGRTLVLDKSTEVIEKALEYLRDRVVVLSPVGDPPSWARPYWPSGYVPGKYKASWGIKKESENIWTIFNPQPYSYRLEYGWSKQAPLGILRIGINEFDQMLKRATQNTRKL